MPKSKELQRIQFEASPRQIADMDEMEEACEFNTRKDLIAHALGFWRWAVMEARKGNEIASVDEKAQVVKVVHVPALENARRNYPPAIGPATARLLENEESAIGRTRPVG